MPPRFQFSVRASIFMVTIIAALALEWASLFRLPLAIRQPATIASMAAVLYPRAPDLPQIEEFDVPSSQFASILRPLSEARVDYSPAKWQLFGELRMRNKDGSPTAVRLYLTEMGSTTPGIAFSCGGKYYKGGSAWEVEEAVIAAKTEKEK